MALQLSNTLLSPQPLSTPNMSIGGVTTPQASQVTTSPNVSFNGSMPTFSPSTTYTPSAQSILPSHPALATAANSHPTSLTTSPDGTVKATYPQTSGLINPPTVNPNQNLNNVTSPYAITSPVVANTAPEGNGGGASGTINTPTTQGTPTFPGLVSSVAQSAQGAPAIGQQAENIANEANAKVQNIAQQAAQSEGGYLTGGGLSPDLQGRAATVANLAQNQIANVIAGGNLGLSGTAQGLSAQGQQTQGLTSAGQLAQPSGNFPFVFNPTTGTFSSGAGGTTGTAGSPTLSYNPQTDATSLATAVINGQISYSDATSALGYAGSVAPGLLSTAILAQGGNPTNLQAQASGIAQGIGQAGINAGTAAQAIGKATPIAQNLDSLITQNGINPTDITYLNGAVNFVKSNFGTPTQQSAITEFNGQLNDLASTLSQVLGIPASGTTDFRTSLGQSIVNGLQNGTSIQNEIQYFISQAQQGAAGAYSGGTNPLQTINTPSTGGSVTAGGYTYVKNAQGNWVPQS